jgi:hypothetical protein
MFELWGENYYLDLEKIQGESQFVNESGETQVHVVKYDTLRLLIETVMTEDEVDEKLGMKGSDISLPFKLAFNTLLVNKIINKF